jgi:hypothetical protein
MKVETLFVIYFATQSQPRCNCGRWDVVELEASLNDRVNNGLYGCTVTLLLVQVVVTLQQLRSNSNITCSFPLAVQVFQTFEPGIWRLQHGENLWRQ